jgi:hypothetical protein
LALAIVETPAFHPRHFPFVLQTLEHLQRDLHFELGRSLFDVAKEETATAAAPRQQTVTLAPPALGRLWKGKDRLAYSAAALSFLFGGFWCFKICDRIFNETCDTSKKCVAAVVAAASAIVALSAMPPPPQPPSPALSAKLRLHSLLDHFVTLFTNQISHVPNGIITIFKKPTPEFAVTSARLCAHSAAARVEEW